MPKVNKHTQELFKYIFYAPEEIQKKYYNGFAREIIYRPDVYKEDGDVKKNSIGKIIVQEKKEKNIDWYRYRNNKGDCIFNGIIFKDNRVFLYNIQMYDAKNNYEPKYLEITHVFNRLLKELNIYHLCIALSKAMQNYYKESNTAENIIIFRKYDKEYYHHRFRYDVIKHHSRERKFIESNKNKSRRIWTKIILSAIHKTSEYHIFRHLRAERPNSFYFTYLPHTKAEEQRILADIQNSSTSLRRPYTRKCERKNRRRFNL